MFLGQQVAAQFGAMNVPGAQLLPIEGGALPAAPPPIVVELNPTILFRALQQIGLATVTVVNESMIITLRHFNGVVVTPRQAETDGISVHVHSDIPLPAVFDDLQNHPDMPNALELRLSQHDLDFYIDSDTPLDTHRPATISYNPQEPPHQWMVIRVPFAPEENDPMGEI